jgi:hypothetical protein
MNTIYKALDAVSNISLLFVFYASILLSISICTLAFFRATSNSSNISNSFLVGLISLAPPTASINSLNILPSNLCVISSSMVGVVAIEVSFRE